MLSVFKAIKEQYLHIVNHRTIDKAYSSKTQSIKNKRSDTILSLLNKTTYKMQAFKLLSS